MSDFTRLKRELRKTPILHVDADANSCRLVSDREASRIMDDQSDDVFARAFLMNLAESLERFRSIVGNEDRTFTLADIGTITATDVTKAHQWVAEGIIHTLCDGNVSWRSAFSAGVCGSLRRQGIGLAMLRKVSRLLSTARVEA